MGFEEINKNGIRPVSRPPILAIPSAQQVLVEKKMGRPLTVNQAECVNMITPHFLSSLEIRYLKLDPLFCATVKCSRWLEYQ